MSLPKPLGIGAVEQCEFERSKTWGLFLNDILAREEPNIEGIDIAHIEDNFHSSEESSDSEASIEDAEGEKFEKESILQDITNREMRDTHVDTQEQRQTNDTTMRASNSFADEDEDFLNQTRPVLVEHERKWKEAGLEAVLNSFDPQKIEEKVGGWLRRNHSASNTLAFSSYSPPAYSLYRNCLPSIKSPHLCSNNSDTDSLESIDTARYIRSSRKRLNRRRYVGAYSANASMTIKTYRLVQSRRDALRKKYASLDCDEPHFSGSRSRVQRGRKQCTCHAIGMPKRLSVQRAIEMVQRISRRKLMRQLRNSSCTTSSMLSSSDDERLNNVRHGVCSPSSRLNPRRRALPYVLDHRNPPEWIGNCNVPSAAKPYVLAPHKRNTDEDSDEESPCNSKKAIAHNYLRNRKLEYVRGHNEKLGQQELDSAGINFDQWLENLQTPKRAPRMPVDRPALMMTTPSKLSTPSTTKTKLKETNLQTEPESTPRLKQNNEKKKQTEKAKEEKKPIKENSEKAKFKEEANVKTKKYTSRPSRVVQKEKESSDSDSDFQKQLQLAIEQSKKTFELENIKCAATNDVIDISSGSEMSEKRIPIKPHDLVESPDKHTFEVSTAPKNLNELDPACCPTLSQLKPQPRFAKMRKMSKMLLPDDTFLAGAKNICNSTAMKNDEATTRQIASETTKTLPTILETPIAKKASPRAFSAMKNKPSSDSLPSPTTSSNSSRTSNSKKKNITNSNKSKQLLKSNYKTDKGILLYAPYYQHQAPEHSLRDGYFHITEEHLAKIVDEKTARNFMKYYLGKRRFNSSSAVYFQPPPPSILYSRIETDSDDDALERVGLYGELIESFNNASD